MAENRRAAVLAIQKVVEEEMDELPQRPECEIADIFCKGEGRESGAHRQVCKSGLRIEMRHHPCNSKASEGTYVDDHTRDEHQDCESMERLPPRIQRYRQIVPISGIPYVRMFWWISVRCRCPVWCNQVDRTEQWFDSHAEVWPAHLPRAG